MSSPDGDEGDGELPTGELLGEVVGQPALQDRRRDIGVDDDVGHAMPARREA